MKPTQEPLFAIAGLWEPANDLSELPTFAFVTTEPNAVVADANDRMPVVLAEQDVDLWLNPGTPQSDLTALLTPCPDEWLEIEDAGLIGKPRKEVPEQETLF